MVFPFSKRKKRNRKRERERVCVRVCVCMYVFVVGRRDPCEYLKYLHKTAECVADQLVYVLKENINFFLKRPNGFFINTINWLGKHKEYSDF